MSDSELIHRYKQSEDLALLGELFTRYKVLVYGVCLKYLKDRDDAKDATMQVFEKLISTLRTHEIDHFKSWIYITSRNHCLMQIRARKGKFTGDLSEHLMESPVLVHLNDETGEENLQRLEKCIEKLAAEQQLCVRLFFIDEKSYKEVVVATGYDFNQVKSFIQNGKRNLKICMDSHES